MGKAKASALQGALDLLILRSLAGGPLHGYGIGSNIEKVTDDVLRVEEGSLYPALHRIEQAGWITSEWRASETKRQAKYYRLTAAGRRQLIDEEANWRRIVGGVDRFLRLA
jgi:PadR family transcriptional regulator, regulatory protein PadR